MMSALRKFLPGKKKNKKSTSSSIKSAVSEQNIAGAEQVPGNKDVKEKDLPKLHKAAWHGDMAKLKQLLKKTDVNSMDRHHRYELCVCLGIYFASWYKTPQKATTGYEDIASYEMLSLLQALFCVPYV